MPLTSMNPTACVRVHSMRQRPRIAACSCDEQRSRKETHDGRDALACARRHARTRLGKIANWVDPNSAALWVLNIGLSSGCRRVFSLCRFHALGCHSVHRWVVVGVIGLLLGSLGYFLLFLK